MNETPAEAKPAPAFKTAGSMLREARQAQGLHIAALAASIKVTQRKLELLEADRFDELPDATFARALAQTVCRTLKVDPAPVLALLPAPSGHQRLEHVAEGINEPFRERPGRHEPRDWTMLASPGIWGPLLLLLAAAVVYLLPEGWFSSLAIWAPSASSPAPSAATSPTVPGTVSAVVPSSVVSESMPASSATQAQSQVQPIAQAPQTPAVVTSSAPAASGPLQVRATTKASWVEVQDARRQVLLSRVVEPGETVVLDGAMPLRVKIGNAVATELVLRGQKVDLAPSTRDNVARLELK